MESRRDQEEGSGLSSQRGARAYQWAMEAAFSIPIATGLGWWADSYFETEPILLLVGMLIGFGAFVMRLVRMRHLVEEAAAEAEEAGVPTLGFPEEDEEDEDER